MTSRKFLAFLDPLPPFCHAFTQPISTVCHVLATPLPPPLQRDVIYGWSLSNNHSAENSIKFCRDSIELCPCFVRYSSTASSHLDGIWKQAELRDKTRELNNDCRRITLRVRWFISTARKEKQVTYEGGGRSMDLGTILYDLWHLCGAQQRCQFSYLWAGGTHRYELSQGNEN